MALFMLDTDICSYIMKRSNQDLLRRLQSLPVADICISVITKAELLYGIAISPRRERDQEALHAYLHHVQVLELPEAAAWSYAEIRAALKLTGTPIGSNDLWIAAHARTLGLTLVTNNVREFSRIAGLAVENWMVLVR